MDRIKEIIQMLMGTMDEKERLSLLEELTGMLDTLGGDNSSSKVEELEAELLAQKRKYIDRFCSGGETSNPENDTKKEEDEAEEKESKITLDDLGYK